MKALGGATIKALWHDEDKREESLRQIVGERLSLLCVLCTWTRPSKKSVITLPAGLGTRPRARFWKSAPQSALGLTPSIQRVEWA
jgi:hypothetical protein